MGLFSAPPINATTSEYIDCAKQNISLFEQENNGELDYLLLLAITSLELAIKELNKGKNVNNKC